MGIAGTVFTTKVQCDILVPIIPLFWHSTDHPMQAMAARTIGAFRVAVKKLEHHYSSSHTTPEPIRANEDDICPYPRHYSDSAGIQQEFTYDTDQPHRKQLIFYGKSNGGRNICLKFVRRYSREAHVFCASKGHAPELIAFESLSGGWNMVVMEVIDIHRGPSPRRTGSYQQFHYDMRGILSLKRPIATLIKQLHAKGYVHGDVRAANLFVQVDDDEEVTPKTNFKLIDFDWAGRIGEAKYPMYVNRQGIRRPQNARDGREILKTDDLEMLKFLFPFQQPTASGQKRKRKRKK